jgi:hypothetical protein
VNEGSSHAVFTINGAASQVITSLALGSGLVNSATGAGAEYGTASGTGLEYWNGSAWTEYVSGSVSLDATGNLLVRTPIINDSIIDHNEIFTLTAVNSASGNSVGTAVIVDDGTGTLFTSGNPVGNTPATLAPPTGAVLEADIASLRDDDRILMVSSVTVNEASPFAIFSVTGADGQYIKVALKSLYAKLSIGLMTKIIV